MSDFVVAYCGDVAAADQELHHLGAFAGKLGPSRRGRRILLEDADALGGKFEIHLRELAFRRALHGIGIVAYDYTLFAVDERLTPDGQARFIQVGLLVFLGHCQSVPRQSLSSEANHSAPLLPSCRVKREGHEAHILIYAVGICFCRCVCLCCFCADAAAPVVSPEVHPDNRVTFRFRAPNAKEAKLSMEGTSKDLTMQKDEQGV